MTELNFVFTEAFDDSFRKLGLKNDDKKKIIAYIYDYYLQDPDNNHGKRFPGDIIRSTKGAYKLRYSGYMSNVGKSGSYRIIYFIVKNSNVIFVEIYKKGVQDSLNMKQKRMLRNMAKIARKEI